jgi:hypothetical protein
MNKFFGNRWARFGIQAAISLIVILLVFVIGANVTNVGSGTSGAILFLGVAGYFVLSTLLYLPYDSYYNVGLLDGEKAQEVQPKAKAFLKNLFLFIFFIVLAIIQLLFVLFSILNADEVSAGISGFWSFVIYGCAGGLFLAAFLEYWAFCIIVAKNGKGYSSTFSKVISPFITIICFIVAIAVAGGLSNIAELGKYIGIIFLVFLGFVLLLTFKSYKAKIKKEKSSKTSFSSTTSSSSSDNYNSDLVESKMNYVDLESGHNEQLGTIASVTFEVRHTIAYNGDGNYTINFTYDATVYQFDKLKTQNEVDIAKKNLKSAIDNMSDKIMGNAKRELNKLNGNFKVNVVLGRVNNM